MTAKIKLNAASGGGSISIQAPSSSSNNRVIALPDIADGTLLTSQSSLDSTKLSPAISAGITMSDHWRRTTAENLGAGTSQLDNYWARQTGLYEGIGSAMTQPSTGQFQFPSTGKYFIMLSVQFSSGNNQDYIGTYIRHSTDSGSNFSTHALGLDSCSSGGTNYVRVVVSTFLDVTAPSTQRVSFQALVQDTASVKSDPGETSLMFIRLGDT